jgi:hypothetical protein
MRSLLRFALVALLVLGLLAALGFGGAAWYIMRKLGPDFWVALIEQNTNCRAQIDGAHLSLFSSPATLKLTGVRLAPRDEEVAKPFADRAPLKGDSQPVVIPEVAMDVRLEDLLNRRLFVQRLYIVKPVVNEVLDENGRSSLQTLFDKDATALTTGGDVPRAIPVSPAPLAPPAMPPGAVRPPPPVAMQPQQAPLPQAPMPEPTPAAPERGSADPSFFAYSVASAEIEKGTLTLVSRDSTTSIQNLDFSVTDFDLDPDPAHMAKPMAITLSSEISVKAMARVGGVKRPAEIAHLLLSGTGDLANSTPGTRVWRPATHLSLTLAKGSVLGGHVTVGDSAGKEVRKLQEYGIDLTSLRIGGPLLADAVVTGVYLDNQFTLTEGAQFLFPDYQLAIAPKSWLNTAKDQHAMRLALTCSPALQQRLEAGVAKAKLGESIARAVTKALSDEQGRMTFDIISSGSLSNPEVKPSIDRLLNNLLRGQGLGDLLQGLLKKL